jgi:protein-tyrosine-phosphatase
LPEKCVVFVCTANRCRSLMAEFYLRHLLAGTTSAGKVEIKSAGIMTEEYWRFLQGYLAVYGRSLEWENFYGVPPYPSTISIMRKQGWDTEHYRSQPLSLSLADEASVVIAMENPQKEASLKSFPVLAGRVLTLRELAGETGPLLLEESYYRPEFNPSDPHLVYYGEDYVEDSFQEIKDCLEKGFPWLLEQVGLTPE